MKIRLPRKRKKWLKKFGGFEYYIQVPPKNVGEATIEDFMSVMDELAKDYVEPKYYDNGRLIEVTSKDENGITWVTVMKTEAFHEAMVKEVKRQFGK